MKGGYYFISHSVADGREFAQRLAEQLEHASPPVRVWLDKRPPGDLDAAGGRLRPGYDWDAQMDEAIRRCDGVLFVMTRDSVRDTSVCKLEWGTALQFKKLVIPLRLHRDAAMPFGLGRRQYHDFSGDFDQALRELRDHFEWMASPEGLLFELRVMLADAERDLDRARDEPARTRVLADINSLRDRIAEQERIVADPQDAERRTEQRIERGLEQQRTATPPPTPSDVRTRVVNPPPAAAPTYFQDRVVETSLVADWLADESVRLVTVLGRAGVGKTSLVCRLLKAMESARLPDGGELDVDGVVYLTARGAHRVALPYLHADLLKLLPQGTADRLEELYNDSEIGAGQKMQELCEAFPNGRVVVLLDNFEDALDPESLAVHDAELDEGLRALLRLPQHGIKVVMTTRYAPPSLMLVEPGRQRRLDLEEGLASPYAENILREMDADGKLGLKTAPNSLLDDAREWTRGYPRALEALYAILSTDRSATLPELLTGADAPLPENVVEVLVGEAYSRLDEGAQGVMQALAVYGRPVAATAVDYLLQAYVVGVNSTPVLRRLVNMRFVRREEGKYYLHPVDQQYALDRLLEGEEKDRGAEPPVFTRLALYDRAAEYYREARTPRESWKRIEDLEPQLAEYELRYEGRDYIGAASVLDEIDFDYLLLWGRSPQVIELHERLREKLDDPDARRSSVGALGTAYHHAGRVQTAIECFEEALSLARELQNRESEGACLGNLGDCHSDLGQTARAIEYHEQALAIAREIGDEGGEGAELGALGLCSADLGETDRALEYYERAVNMAKSMGYGYGECARLANLADVLTLADRYPEAIERAQEAVAIANEIGADRVGSYGNVMLAQALLFNGDLPAARSAAEAARAYDVPENIPDVQALLGVIALRLGDKRAALEAFEAAAGYTAGMLALNPISFQALDAKGLALCGQALSGNENAQSEGVEAYLAARSVTKAQGIVKRAVRRLEELAKVDAEGIIAEARRAAAGDG